jgi:hypothetical protein
VATVAGAMFADAAATLFASFRLTFHTAAYYGFDVSRPDERLRALAVLNIAALTDQGAKHRAYRDLNELMKLLAHHATWKQLDENATTKIVQRVFRALNERLTQNNLGTTIPFIGVAVGSASNWQTLGRVGDAADRLYREAFLRERLDIDLPTDADVIDAAQGIELVAIVEDALKAAPDENGDVSAGSVL